MEVILEKDKDTICAISTAPGVGGIAVLRVSGEKAFSVVKSICAFLPGNPESHRVYYGFLNTFEANENIDEVLVTYFKKGRSFTGEETLEISCHGGEYLSQKILNELRKSGARLAEKGEFTYRAFMQGNLDLVQAESVLALIESQSKESANLALRQLKGELSDVFSQLEEDLLWTAANLEANIDYASEDIVVATQDVIDSRLQKVKRTISEMLFSYEKGRIAREGLQVALAGKPNVGKSSLLNLLIEQDRAIVTDQPGTTRDTVEAKIRIGGTTVNLVDTAGLRETSDIIEQAGIDKANIAHKESDLVIFLIDLSKPLCREEVESLNGLKNKNLIIALNKLDIATWGAGNFRDELLVNIEFLQNGTDEKGGDEDGDKDSGGSSGRRVCIKHSG